VNPADLGEHVDASGLDPNLQPDPGSLQIGFGESHQRSAEFDEPVDDLRCIFCARLDPDVEIFRRAWSSMDANGVGSNHQKSNVSA